MLSKNVNLVPVGLLCLMTLVGCKRAVDWATSNFNQGESADVPLAIVKPYIKNVVVHSQLSTRGIFDAIWLSDAVRTASTDVLIMRSGKSIEQHHALLRRQLEENKHYIMFYVLTEYDIPLGDCAEWQIFLRVGEYNYQPRELKVVDLPCEYKAFFGKRYMKTKMAYLVKFDMADANEQPIMVPHHTQSMQLSFRSVEKQATLEWLLDGSTKAVRDV